MIISRRDSGRKDGAYKALSFCLGIPNFDNSRITSDQECPSSLPPVDDHASSLSNGNNFIQCPERADHLQLLLESRVVVAVQSYDTIS